MCRYLRVNDTVSNNAARLSMGRIYDPRPFANVSSNTFSADEIFRDSACPVNSRHIFGYVTAFAYHSIDNTTLAPTVSLEQVDPGAYGFMDAGRDDEDASEDEDEEDELVAGTNPDAAAIRGLELYQKRILDLKKHHVTDLDNVPLPTRYPFAGLVLDLHASILCPEVFALIQFPLAMGCRVTPYIMEHAHHPVLMDELCLQLAAIAKLARIESEQFSHGLMNYDQEDLVHDAAALTDEPDTLNETGLRLVEKQQTIVETALRELSGLAHGGDHPLLFNSAYGRCKQSTHEVMHMDDFLWVRTGQHGPTSNETESVLYVRERMRHTIRKELRAAGNIDTTILEEYGRVRSLTGDTLRTIQGEQHAREEESLLSRTGTDYAKSRVDPIDIDFRSRDDFLEARVDNQCATVLRSLRADTRFQQLTTTEERNAFYESFREQTYAHWRLCINGVITLLRESQNIPKSLSGVEFQSYYNRVCTPEGLKLLLCDRPKYDYDATPFTVCMQTLVDLATDVHKTSPMTLSPALLLFFMAMDGLTYEFGRMNPALNGVIAAATGIGKTFMGEFIKMLFPPGIIMSLTNVTKNTFNTDKSYDALTMIMGEMKAAYMGFQSKEAREAGSSEEINFLKERMTSFQSRVERTIKDAKSGKTSIETTKSSHHNVLLGFTNQNMTFLDPAVRRRFIVLFVPKNMRIPSINPDSMTDFYGKAWAHKIQYERMRAVMSLFVTVRCCHKAAALPPPVTTALGTWIQRINEVARGRGMSKIFEGSNMHYVIQLTIMIQLFYACWYGLMSPDAHEFHEDPEAPDRWSADAILQLVGPNMAVTKPALIYGLGLLENVIMPVYITRLLRDILLEGIQIGSGRMRVRRTDVPDRGTVEPAFDCAYLTLTDRNWKALMTTIQKLSKDYELRIEEIQLFLGELCDQRILAKKDIKCERIDDDQCVVGLTAVPFPAGSVRRSMAPVILEVDEPPGKRKGYRICLYIPYLEELFDIKICDNANLADVAVKLARTNVQQKTYAECTDSFLAEHMTLKPENSVLMDIVREALESDILEKSPFERPNMVPNPTITRYITPLQAEPIILETAEARASGQSMYMTLPMVMLHGTGRSLHLKRTDKPMPPIMMTDFGQPTSERTNKRARDTEKIRDVRSEFLRGASTMRSTLVDPDYTAAKEMVQALGLPVSPLVRKAYGDNVAMRSGLILPLGFMPVTYFVARSLSRRTKADKAFLDYPMDNVRYKINNADKRLRGINTDEISADHVDIELMSGTATIGGITFSVPGVSSDAWDAYNAQMDEIGMQLEDATFDWFYQETDGGGAEDDSDAMDIDEPRARARQ